MVANWVTDAQDDISRENRELFALAGTALYCAQCLEHEIVNILAIGAMLRKSGKRASLKRGQDNERCMDSLWGNGFKKTLGALIKSLDESGVSVPTEIREDLVRSRDARNRLAHHFFRENAEAFLQPEGRRRMAEDLKEMLEQFLKTDTELHDLADPKIKAVRRLTDPSVRRYVELRKEGVDQERATEIAWGESRAIADSSRPQMK